jgi:uncharacterized DUF497 family protein
LYILNDVRVGCSGGCDQSGERRVSFEKAATVFADPDLKHSEREERLLRLGSSLTGRVLIVAYTVRGAGDGEKICIISARRASGKERAPYAGGAAD